MIWFHRMLDAIDELAGQSLSHDPATAMPLTESAQIPGDCLNVLPFDREEYEEVPIRPTVLAFPDTAGFSLPSRRSYQTEKKTERTPIKPILAPEGTPLPNGIPDLRPLLRRDGLILLSWKQMKTEPLTYEVFWVTKTGMLHTYAALSVPEKDLGSAMPNKGTDVTPFAVPGIHFSGPDSLISYWVHVAPRNISERQEYVKKLEAMGIDTGPDVKFSMKQQKQERTKAV
jgi:hypothetical protein